MEKERAESHAKILIATSAINYMSHCLFNVNQQIKQIIHLKPEQDEIHGEGVRQRDKVLEDTVHNLGIIMNELGDCMNNHDCICEFDARVIKEAFEIIVHKKDNVDE